MTTETFQYTPLHYRDSGGVQSPDEAKYHALRAAQTRIQYHGYMPPTTQLAVTEENVAWVKESWNHERGVYNVTAFSGKRWAVTTANPFKGRVGWWTSCDRLILGLESRRDEVEKFTFATAEEAEKFRKVLAKKFAERLEIQTVSEKYRHLMPALANATTDQTAAAHLYTQVGDVVLVRGFGKLRNGVVVKTSKTRVLVAYVTPSNPTEIHTAWEKRR